MRITEAELVNHLWDCLRVTCIQLGGDIVVAQPDHWLDLGFIPGSSVTQNPITQQQLGQRLGRPGFVGARAGFKVAIQMHHCDLGARWDFVSAQRLGGGMGRLGKNETEGGGDGDECSAKRLFHKF